MTPRSKLYLKITIVALLIAAGSAMYHRYEIAKFAPPPPPAEEETQGEAPPALYAEPAPDEAPPADTPRGWSGRNTASALAQTQGEAFAALEEKLQAFNKEIEAALAAIPQDIMLTSNAEEIFLGNPQIQKILLKYSKDPAFMQLMEKMTAGSVLGGAAPAAAARGAQKNAKQK